MTDASLPRIPRTPATIVRPLTVADLSHVDSIQREAYRSTYHESMDSFAAKIAASAATCFGAWYEGDMIGYLVAFGVANDEPVALDATSTRIAPIETAETIHIHDLAVRPTERGKGIGDVLLVHLYEVASGHGVDRYRLVSVQGSSGFWADRGFTIEPGPPPEGYGSEAVVMMRR